jgi:RNA polymerase sigma-70 factor (ECF subfamily)
MEVTVSSEKAKRDYELICKAREKGDQRAYAQLMEFYKEQLYHLLLRYTHDTILAEDLTIEAFGKAFKSIDKYTPDFAFSTWLYRIATNNYIDYTRKKRLHTISMDQEESELNLVSQSQTPEDKVIESQKHETLRNVINKLKPHYRTLIEMRYFEEKSYEEISQELALPIGTVKAKLFRAREFLYNLVKDNSAF